MNIFNKIKSYLTRTKSSKTELSCVKLDQNYNMKDDNIEFIYQSLYSPINDINCALLNLSTNATGDTIYWKGYSDIDFRETLDDMGLQYYINRYGNFSTETIKATSGDIYNLYRINIDIITGKKDFSAFMATIRNLLPEARCLQFEKKGTRRIFTFSIGLKDACEFIYNPKNYEDYSFALSLAKFLNNIMKNIIDHELDQYSWIPDTVIRRYNRNLPEIVNYLGKFDEDTYLGFGNHNTLHYDPNCKKYFAIRYASGEESNFNIKDNIRSRFILLSIDNTMPNLIDDNNRLVTIIERQFDVYSYINPIIDSYYKDGDYNLGLLKPGNNVMYTMNERHVEENDEMHVFHQWAKNGYFYDFVFQIPIRVFNEIYERYSNHGDNLDDTSQDLTFIKSCIEGKFDYD